MPHCLLRSGGKLIVGTIEIIIEKSRIAWHGRKRENRNKRGAQKTHILTSYELSFSFLYERIFLRCYQTYFPWLSSPLPLCVFSFCFRFSPFGPGECGTVAPPPSEWTVSNFSMSYPASGIVFCYSPPPAQVQTLWHRRQRPF